MGARRGRLSSPWLRFHGGGAADVYIIIRVRASGNGECALTPADPTIHSPPKTFARPCTLPLPHAVPTHTRRPHNTFLAEGLLPPQHSDTPCPCPPATSPPRDDARPPTSQHIPRRRSAPVPAQRRALPEPSRHVPAAPTTARRPHDPFPVEDLLPPPHNDTPSSSTFSLPHAAPTQTRRLRHAFLADPTTHSPPKICSRPSTATRPARALSHSLPAPTHTRRLRDARPPTSQPIPRRRPSPAPAAPRCLPFRSAPGTKKRHRTVDVRCRMSRSTVVAVGHWGW